MQNNATQLILTTLKKTPFLLSPILLILGYTYIFKLFDKYDWGHPFTKLLCFASIFIIILFLSKQKKTKPLSLHVYWLEMVLLIFLLVLILNNTGKPHIPNLSRPPTVDIGTTTIKSTTTFFRDKQNPYQSKTISHLGKNPSFWGFKKGPLMFLGYFPSAIFPKSGYKTTNLAFLILTIITIVLLIYDKKSKPLQNIATSLFAITLLLLPKRLWSELFIVGASDILPILLLLLSLLFVRKKLWLVAGLLAGLSFSAKFVPAILFIFLFMRKDLKIKFFIGALLGLIPLIGFLIWDYHALINNVFVFHGTKNFDSTSLYKLTPKALHYLFPLIQLSAIAFIIIKNFTKKINYRTIAIHFTLLFIIIEITYKELHINHLVLFIPFFALILSWYRYAPIKIFCQSLKPNK